MEWDFEKFVKIFWQAASSNHINGKKEIKKKVNIKQKEIILCIIRIKKRKIMNTDLCIFQL
jgi:hypothetical protein